MNLIQIRDEQMKVMKLVAEYRNSVAEGEKDLTRVRVKLRRSVLRGLDLAIPAKDLAVLAGVHVTTIYDWRRATQTGGE